MRMLRFLSALSVASLFAVAVSCDGGPSGPSPVDPAAFPVERIAISPTAPTVMEGQTLQLTATGIHGDQPVAWTPTFAWAAVQPWIAGVSDGMVTGLAPGLTAITVTHQAVSAQVILTVTPIPVASVEVQPSAPVVTIGDTVRLQATARSAGGTTLPRTFTWVSSAPTVASIDATGLLRAVRAGTATITGTTAGNGVVTVPVTVNWPAPDTVAVSPAGPQTLYAGDSLGLQAMVYGRNTLLPTSATWTSSDTAVARVSATGRVTARQAGTTTIRASAGTASAAVAFTVRAVTLDTVLVSQTAVTLAGATTTTLTAAGRDNRGRTLADPVIWGTTNPNVVTVANGVLTGVAAGTATVTATVTSATLGTKTTAVAVTVTPAAVATVTLSPSTAQVPIGTELTLMPTVTDAMGRPLTGRAVTWSSNQPAVATVSTAGVVHGLATGTATIVATSEGRQGTATITVPASTVVITGVSPTVLRPGELLTIQGSGFSATAASDTVRIGDVLASVTAATPTALTVQVPTLPGDACRATAPVPVRVTVVKDSRTESGTREAPYAVATPLTLGLGERFVALAPGSTPSEQCRELVSGDAEYLVTIANATTMPTALSGVRLTGQAGTLPLAPLTAAARVARQPLSARRSSPRSVATGAARRVRPTTPDSLRRAAIAHGRQLDANLALLRQFAGQPAPARRTRFPALIQSVAQGAYTTVNMPPGSGALCGTPVLVRARAAYVGPTVTVLEDSLSPLLGTLDTLYARLGKTFEDRHLPLLRSTFGNPLAYDYALSNTGRITMLFSPEVQARFPSALAFVSSGDFLSTSWCPASNEAAVFYVRAPTTSGMVDTYSRTLEPTLMHEAKHLVSFAERRAKSATVYEESWLEESTARLAEEILARTYHGYTYRGDHGFDAGITCEFRRVYNDPTSGACAAAPAVTPRNWFALANYLRNTAGKSPIDLPSNDGDVYASGWALVRWMLDHQPGDEATVIRSVVTDGTRSGVANLLAHSGRSSWAEMLLGFATSLGADNLSGLAGDGDAAYQGWNLRGVFGGMYDAGYAPSRYPLAVTVGNPAGFTHAVDVKGGSFTTVTVTTPPAGSMALSLAGANGGALPGTMAWSIMRVR